jgi:hypothetical protein
MKSRIAIAMFVTIFLSIPLDMAAQASSSRSKFRVPSMVRTL